MKNELKCQSYEINSICEKTVSACSKNHDRVVGKNLKFGSVICFNICFIWVN